MERLKKGAPIVSLTAEQKAELAEVDSQFRAKIAEKEVFLKGEIAKALAAGQHEEVEKLQRQLTSEIRRLNEHCELKKQKLRDSFNSA